MLHLKSWGEKKKSKLAGEAIILILFIVGNAAL